VSTLLLLLLTSQCISLQATKLICILHHLQLLQQQSQTRQGLTIDVPDYVESEENSGDCSSGSAERDSSEERRRHGSSTDADSHNNSSNSSSNSSRHNTSTDSSSEAAEVRYSQCNACFCNACFRNACYSNALVACLIM
jgi:hypothetical protein